ncbi:MAG: hypothetical protein N2050_09030 [Flavobacteriales bacterium]|nr:hypothetical protein [Flavobacteriales bacterium]MCX7650680.1 hypothetical protein [Flavobacteriales bacterium]MDW8431143.1 hypothetical protein [Flavobacteriales bacterium]
MDRAHFSVFITTLALLVYILLTHYEPWLPIVFGAFLGLHVLYFYMIYTVLRHGKASAYTFEDRMYEDYEVKP